MVGWTDGRMDGWMDGWALLNNPVWPLAQPARFLLALEASSFFFSTTILITNLLAHDSRVGIS